MVKNMSMIINEVGGLDRQVEIPAPLSLTVKSMGVEADMEKATMIAVLHQSMLRTVAHGDSANYKKLQNAIDEIGYWDTSRLHIEF